jgi:hypothetical protein
MSPRRTKIAIATIVAFVAVVAVAIAARGGHDGASPTAGSGGASPPVSKADASPPAGHAAAFAWLHPSDVPAGWTTLRLPDSPARMPVPSGWKHAHGDPGTQTAELKSPSGEIIGYLNATPRQGTESLADWSDFRVDHNRDEGDRDVKLLASVTGFRFPTGTGSCVLDDYRTSSDHHYREFACIVAGEQATTVIVAAAPPENWAAEAPALERAVASFTT